MERLQKIMAHAGVASRRKCEEIIKQGRVKVNGNVVITSGYQVSENDCIEVDGSVITRERRVFILLNKPEGYITSVDDPKGRKTVLDLIKNESRRIYPVGRLDYDTSGLLLLTNDGEITYKLTHPSYMIEKTYLVKVDGIPDKKSLDRLCSGVQLRDGFTAPACVDNIHGNQFELTIHEGRNRQVRRMCRHVGYPVVLLKRIKFSFLTMEGLKKGEYRYLDKKEIRQLKKSIKEEK